MLDGTCQITPFKVRDGVKIPCMEVSQSPCKTWIMLRLYFCAASAARFLARAVYSCPCCAWLRKWHIAAETLEENSVLVIPCPCVECVLAFACPQCRLIAVLASVVLTMSWLLSHGCCVLQARFCLA
jgi:hypothetical protein